MKNEILGVTYTIRQCLIRNINGIFTCCRQGRYPFSKCLILILLFLSFGGDETASTVAERIFPIPINLFLLGESFYRSHCPLRFFASYFQIKGSVGRIIVHYDFILLCVPFAGSINDSACILQHGNHIGQNERLSKQVFCSAEQAGTLPSPFVLVILEIVAMALPDCDVTVL